MLSAGGRLIPFNSFIGPLVQEDWCSPTSMLGRSQTPILQSATDTGEFLAMPVDISSLHTMILEAAFYRQGAPLHTVAERRRAVAGWILTSFDIAAVVRGAIGQNGGLRVDLYHNNPYQPQTFIASAGSVANRGRLTRTANVPMYGVWTIKVRGTPSVQAVSPTVQGVLVFAFGAMVTALLFLLILVLARSRDKALELVAEKTGQLRHQALHDSLTGLPNRVLALDRAELILARARRLQSPAAALYLDIDAFKQVNDSFGHAAGDRVLELVADRLRTVVRESDTAARLSGDEFVVLLDPSPLASTPQRVAERLLEAMRKPYDLNGTVGRQLTLTASIGIAHGMDDTAERLLANADVALYVAKTSGRDRYVTFESGMLAAAHDRLTLEMDLADALASEQLFLLYQPTIALDSERVTGVEALLRWRHPERGIVMPDVFIPLAEASGLIVPIGRWVLEQACSQAVAWRELGHELRISVNVSGRQLERDEDLVGHVRAALERSGLPPASLTLEITETVLAHDPVAAAQRLLKLKHLGVRIAIDDFGTGYSSLAYLREFPVDALKIDRSFVRTMSGSAQSAALIRTLVRLGKALQLETFAEGIESRSQLQTLRRHHCDEGQGFLFARPLTPRALEDYLASPEVQAAAS